MTILKKPDLSKPVFKMNPGYKQAIQENRCPMCKKPIGGPKDFRDDLSRKEYGISGMCQECQDKTFRKR